jgi:hypothetical protein
MREATPILLHFSEQTLNDPTLFYSPLHKTSNDEHHFRHLTREGGQLYSISLPPIFVTPPETSPHDVNLDGKTAIVTGSNTGLGLECARQLLDLGLSKLIIAVRDESKGEIARQDLSKNRTLKEGGIEVWRLDCLSYDSVIKFAERAKSLEHLDIVVLNAGVYKVHPKFHPDTRYEESI